MPPYAVLQRSQDGDVYERLIYRTRVLRPGDPVERMVREIVGPDLRPGDIILISSRAVAACQGRLLPLSEIKTGRLARLLARSMHSSLHNAHLSHPAAMHVAIENIQASTLLKLGYAAFANNRYPVGLAASLIRIGREHDLDVYHGKISQAPHRADDLAVRIWRQTGYRTAIISVNDRKQALIVGASHGLSHRLLKSLVLDDPLGPVLQQTPVGILRQRMI